MAAPLKSRVLDRATGALGLLVLLGALLLLREPPPAFAWLALPVVVVVSRTPLVLPTGSTESLVIGLDSSLLVLLGLSIPTGPALLVWAASITVAEMTTKRTLDTRVFNAGVCVLAGAAALPIIGPVSAREVSSLHGLLVVLLAATVYFAVDYLWSAVAIGVAEGTPLRQLVEPRGLPLALGCFLGVDSVGFLAALVLHEQPWALGLLCVPFGALMWASRSWSSMGRAERRGHELSRACVAVQQAADRGTVRDLVAEHAAAVLRSRARWLDEGEPEPEVGVVLPAAGGRLHVDGRISGEAWAPADLDALRLLVGVAEQTCEGLRLLGELGDSARTDALTGLPNRSVLRTELEQGLRAGRVLSLLYCDLDGFKQVNDRYGHAAGDAVLVQAAQRLRAAVRPGDLAVRLAGDEFAVLLGGAHHDEAAAVSRAVGDRVCADLGLPYDVGGRLVALSVSVGVALADGATAEQLLHGSDAAMYAAKAGGGGRAVDYEPALVQAERDRAQLAAELREGLGRGEVVPHFQPVVSSTGALLGYEALARWQHPVRGLLEPAAFLQLAAAHALLDELGLVVLRDAVTQVAAAAREAGRTLGLAVNANATQLVSGTLHHLLRELLPVEGVRLTVEVTEDELVDATVVASLEQLRALGVQIAVDDFGTGWSSLSLLRRLPVDVVKLDKSFVDDLPEDPRALALARAVVDMARALGLQTVAEGVERLEQGEVLVELGCDALQGWAYGRPSPVPSPALAVPASA